jgi:trehalose 6-phosphate phosphatase
MAYVPEWIDERLAQARRLWFFLDYDGTLADFSPTPEHVDPDPQVVDLLTKLSQHPCFRITIVSGRRLSHIRALLPVSGLMLAGTYGVELHTPQGQLIKRVAYEKIRPTLDALKPGWEHLIAGRNGFYLEDKGWALALHARFAEDTEAERLLDAARREATVPAATGLFRLLGGHKFLEIGPTLAHKGRTVEYVLDHYPWPDALPVYLGDDDKDEEAFGVIKARGGIAILVSREPRNTQADCRLGSPATVRQWLETVYTKSHYVR